MKAYSKRIFINISLIHCEIDDYVKKGLDFIDSIDANNQKLEEIYTSNIAKIGIDDSRLFFNNLLNIYKDSKYSRLRNELGNMFEYFKSKLQNTSVVSEDVLETIEAKLERIRDDFEMLKHNEIQFTLRVRVISTGFDEYMDFNQSHFGRVDSIIDLCENTIDSFEKASEQFISVQDGDVQPTEMINTLKKSINYFSSGLDSLNELLNSSPLSLLKADTKWIADANECLDEVTDILNGKEFTIGNEDIKIRPVTLIEYSLEDLSDILLDFYRTANRYSYTFGGLFPNALSTTIVDQLKEDMILNLNDNEDEMNSRLRSIQNDYVNMFTSGQRTSTVYFGLAATQTYFYLIDVNKEIRDLVEYIEEGDFSDGFSFDAINNKTLTDSISRNFNKAYRDEKLVYTILMVTDNKSQPYNIEASTNYIPIFISMSAIEGIEDFTHELTHTTDEMGEYFRDIYDDLDNMFDLSLDPNFLDFSNVKSAHDFILILEKSNPGFLEITPYGIDKMQDMRTDIRDVFSDYAGYVNDFKELVDSLIAEHGQFDIDGKEIKTIISDINDFVQDVNNDFQQPDSKTIINDVSVNLSAWFDNPPQNLLLKAKWFFDSDTTNDNTLGGLFPDGRMPSVIETKEVVPDKYYLSQNYPNPFNPTTTISYSIPVETLRATSLRQVTLKVYDVLGREVATLVNEAKPVGNYQVNFNAANLTSGIYLYKLKAGEVSQTKKLTLIK
ncbi:MAG: T9SS C-terminal target domain-containing protein [Ignavibacteriales bacterium]|nr:MAG: T9SS C-terminal target domain-containing protein [Ignavibacteriales bacterium]